MKTMLLAAAAALSLGVGSAYADSEGGRSPTPSSPSSRASSPRRRRRTPRPSRQRRTGRRCTPTSPSRTTAPGCSSDPTAVGGAKANRAQIVKRRGRHHCRPFSFQPSLSPQLSPGTPGLLFARLRGHAWRRQPPLPPPPPPPPRGHERRCAGQRRCRSAHRPRTGQPQHSGPDDQHDLHRSRPGSRQSIDANYQAPPGSRGESSCGRRFETRSTSERRERSLRTSRLVINKRRGQSRTHEEDRERYEAMSLPEWRWLGLGAGSAHPTRQIRRNSTGGQTPEDLLPLPGVIAKTPVQNVCAPTQDGRAIDAYVTNANRGTWLFQPDQNGGGNQG